MGWDELIPGPGSQGPIGPRGSDGATGPQGNVIWIAEAGQNGEDGVVIPGPTGATGATGPSGSGAFTFVKKTVDESANNNRGSGANVVVQDTDLQFSMAANTTYIIRGTIWFSVENANLGAGLATQFTGTTSPTLVEGEIRTSGSAGVTSWNARAFTAFDSSNISQKPQGTASTGQAGVIMLFILVQNGANSGSFKFNWCSESSAANSATVRKGSYLEYASF